MNTVRSLACTAAWLLSIAFVSAENWPQFRGPTGQSISGETGLPLKWSATENVAWKTPMGVSQGHLFIRTEKNVICIGSK